MLDVDEILKVGYIMFGGCIRSELVGSMGVMMYYWYRSLFGFNIFSFDGFVCLLESIVGFYIFMILGEVSNFFFLLFFGYFGRF